MGRRNKIEEVGDEMKKPNAMLANIEAKYKSKYQAEFYDKIDVLKQMCIDSAFMAAADVFQMGPGRCESFGKAMMGYLQEMSLMMSADSKDDPELTYTCAKVDQRLKKICGDKFDPWDVRYK